MTPPPPSAPNRNEPTGSPAPATTWAAEMAEAPAATTPRPPPGQMALFPPDELAPAPPRTRRARLPGRIKALLTAIETPTQRPATGLVAASWPDSFFDVAADS